MCSRGSQLEPYVTTSLVQLLCRTTKLCWFDDDHFKMIVDDAKTLLAKGSSGMPVWPYAAPLLPPLPRPSHHFRFRADFCRLDVASCAIRTLCGRYQPGASGEAVHLCTKTATECCGGRQACLVVQGVQGHYLLGLRILHMLVAEFNQPTSGRTMTMHRKLAVAFRDSSLFKIFQVAIAAMQQLQGSHDDKLREQVRPLSAQQFHPLDVFSGRLLFSLSGTCRLRRSGHSTLWIRSECMRWNAG